MKRTLILLPILLLCGPRAGADPEHSGAELFRSGAELFRKWECAGCHERGGPPGMPVQPLEGLSQRYSVGSLTALLAAPPDPMPAFPLSESERSILAHYLIATFP